MVVLSNWAWINRFRSDPSIVSRVLNINGYPFTVAGVLPATYHSIRGYGVEPDFYLPLSKTVDQRFLSRSAPTLR